MLRIIEDIEDETFKNKVARFTGKHKRCASGMHWNDKTSKCEELTGYRGHIQDASDRAHAASDRAYAHLAAHHRDPAHERTIQQTQKKAVNAHKFAYRRSEEAGFNDLAKKHLDQANVHAELHKHFGGHPRDLDPGEENTDWSDVIKSGRSTPRVNYGKY